MEKARLLGSSLVPESTDEDGEVTTCFQPQKPHCFPLEGRNSATSPHIPPDSTKLFICPCCYAQDLPFSKVRVMEALQRLPASGKAVLGAKWHMDMAKGGGPNQAGHCKRDGAYAQGKPSWMPAGAVNEVTHHPSNVQPEPCPYLQGLCPRGGPPALCSIQVRAILP